MKKLLMTLVLMVAAPAPFVAQSRITEVDFPCQLTDYRILQPNTVMVRCDGVDITQFAAMVSLYKLLDESVAYPSVAIGKGSDADGNNQYWLKFTLGQPLEHTQDYELRFSGSYRITRPNKPDTTEYFKSTRFRFTTRPEFNVAKTPGPNTQYLFGPTAVSLAPGAKLVDKSNGREYDLDFTAPDPKNPAAPDPDDLDAAGRIVLNPAPSMLGQKLEVQGVTDIFNQKLTVKPAKSAPPPTAPKTKEAATYHFNVLHQMGEGSKPTWIADVKLAPVLGGLPGRFYLTPSVTVDTGSGKVGETKTNDIINPKFGVSRLVRIRGGILNGIKFSPSISYETNRKGSKRNLLFDGNARIYLSGLENTKAQRSQDAFLRARLENPKVLPHEVPQARFGYSAKFFFGTELGRSLTDNELKSTDQSSAITVPKYGIRRFRPQFSGALEVWRLTTNLSVYPRYLFSTENVTREMDTLQADGTTKKTIFLHTVSGWRPYGELSVSYSFDPAGHYAANTAYKFGSQPPNFDHINTVLSGIVVRF
jgi:hypothetical protein